MRKIFPTFAFLAALLASAPAPAQVTGGNTTGTVVSTCGTLAVAYIAGRPGPITVDTTGKLCDTGAAAGGGAATIADGADVAEGATADAAATPGSTGTVSAKLRLLTSMLSPVAPATATATRSVLFGCQATSAAINPTTGQQAAADCDLNNNLLVSAGGAPNLSTAQVSVTTASTTVAAVRALRRSITITNITGTQQIYCVGNTTATSATGQLIPAVVGASWNVSTTSAINCIAVTGSQTVSTAETF